jgi:RNA polymerase sigma-70 factor (ECF subfamily)
VTGPRVSGFGRPLRIDRMAVPMTTFEVNSGQTLAMTPERLCEEYSVAVCRFAAMVARTSGDAEDIAQEALLKAIRSLAGFDPKRGSIDSWLWRIVVNAAHDHQRSERRRLVLWNRLLRFREEPSEAVEARALDNLSNAELLDAARGLQPRDRTLLALRFGADLDLAAVGAAVGLSEATAGQAVLRALNKLRNRLEVNQA